MAGQRGFFDAGERLKALSVAGDPRERGHQLFLPSLQMGRGPSGGRRPAGL